MVTPYSLNLWAKIQSFGVYWEHQAPIWSPDIRHHTNQLTKTLHTERSNMLRTAAQCYPPAQAIFSRPPDAEAHGVIFEA